jgi:hypothetical protein
VVVGDGSDAGGTAEDRFFGVYYTNGISAIRIAMHGTSDFEVDHLQYGRGAKVVGGAEASIRMAVQISWASASNATYQVQWAGRLDTNTRRNIGAPVLGNGTTNAVYDPLGLGDSRFYRVLQIQ